MAKVSSDFYGSLPTGECILLIDCLYSRYPMVRIVHSKSAKAAILKLEEILSEFGILRKNSSLIMGNQSTQVNLKITKRVMDFKQNQLHQKSQKQMEHLKASRKTFPRKFKQPYQKERLA